jgi:integrase
VDGRRRDFGLGSVILERKVPSPLPVEQRRELTLSEARDKAAAGRSLAKAGLDPSLEWKRVLNVIPTFEEAARKYHGNVKDGWKAGTKHGAQWIATLEAHAFPVIGSKRIDLIDAPAIQSVLLPIWLRLPETARRVRQRIGAVLDFAHGQGWREGEAPMRAVAKGLPKQPRKGVHYAAMPYADLPAFMDTLRGMEPTLGRLALQFTILTAARSGEVRGATWDEIDMDSALWAIPAARMKSGEAHTVPLSAAALDVLREVQGFITGRPGEPIFPGLKGKPLSDMTLAKALRVAGGDGVTVHGMRSAFRDWVAEKMPTVPGDVAEAALAHAIQNRTEAAYRRAKYLDQRRELMTKWAEYLAGSSNVIALVDRRA